MNEGEQSSMSVWLLEAVDRERRMIREHVTKKVTFELGLTE